MQQSQAFGPPDSSTAKSMRILALAAPPPPDRKRQVPPTPKWATPSQPHAKKTCRVANHGDAGGPPSTQNDGGVSASTGGSSIIRDMLLASEQQKPSPSSPSPSSPCPPPPRRRQESPKPTATGWPLTECFNKRHGKGCVGADPVCKLGSLRSRTTLIPGGPKAKRMWNEWVREWNEWNECGGMNGLE